MRKINWDEPYVEKTLQGDDILVGAHQNGALIYLPAQKGDPTRNVIAFTGSREQNKAFLTTNLFNSILGGKSIVIESSDIKNEIFGFARSHDYIVKDLDVEGMSNHLKLLDLMDDEQPIEEVHKFINRLIVSSKSHVTIHQNNAFNYLSSVLLYVRYTKKGELKDVIKYIRDFDSFEKDIMKCDPRDPARQMFEFSKQANNYLKWDIPCLSDLFRPFLSRTVSKTLGTGSMTIDELESSKCIYILKPSGLCPWLVPFLMSYALEAKADLDIYFDEINMCVPNFKKNLYSNDKRIFVVSRNFSDIADNYGDDLLSLFGTKISFHGCDMQAAEYLHRVSGIKPGSNKMDQIWTPQEIANCGHKNILLFVLSAKLYSYKFVDISFLNDVLGASLKDARKE